MGCQGSGNNLIGLILDRHPRISVYLGTHYYVLFGADRHRYGNLGKTANLARLVRDFQQVSKARTPTTPEAGEILAAVVEPTFEGVLAAFLRLYARHQGAARVGERTSQHYLYLRDIQEGFPGSPVIFTVRDPRDIAFTIRGGLGTGLSGSVRAWNEALRSYSESSRPVHLVRYEDLVQTPAEVVAGICAFLDERYEPAMLRFYERTPAHFRDQNHHRKLFQPLDARSVGEFSRMSREEIGAIESACAEGMQAMGYAFTIPASDRAGMRLPRKRRGGGFLFDRLRYYGLNRGRRRLGLLRWKIVLRVRARYLLRLGFVRKDW
jgi:hypothetical protein